jgi:hypothetical protein
MRKLSNCFTIWRLVASLVGFASSSMTAPSPDRPPETVVKKSVRVVDADGKPVAGATLDPWAIQADQQGQLPFRQPGLPQPIITDTDGMAKIAYPRLVGFAMKTSPKSVICRLYHSDYADRMDFLSLDVSQATVDNVATLILPRGARVELMALLEDKALPIEHVYAAWNDGGLGTPTRRKISAEGRLQLPQFLLGSKELLVAYAPKEGPILFSEFETVEIKNAEKRELRIALKPGVIVSGRLDDHVPRPVKNGRVVGQVISRHNAEWRDAATIKGDGSFTLGPFPHGDLQLIAICDGYMARSGEAPDFVPEARRGGGYNRPQVFPLTKEKADITVLMTPTVDCQVRLLDSDGHPAVGAKCWGNPNVGWWNGGSQGYCDPMYSSLQRLTQPNLKSDPKDRLFFAETDADGWAVVKNLPPTEKGIALFYDRTTRFVRVSFKAGEQNKFLIKLPPKGSKSPVTTEALP